MKKYILQKPMSQYRAHTYTHIERKKSVKKIALTRAVVRTEIYTANAMALYCLSFCLFEYWHIFSSRKILGSDCHCRINIVFKWHKYLYSCCFGFVRTPKCNVFSLSNFSFFLVHSVFFLLSLYSSLHLFLARCISSVKKSTKKNLCFTFSAVFSLWMRSMSESPSNR